MTTVTPTADAIVQQIAQLTTQLEATMHTPAVDPKFAVTAEFVELPKTETDALLKAYKKAEARFKAAKEALEARKTEIINAMAGAEILVVAETKQQLVEHRVVEGIVLDTTKLKKEHPQLAAEYQKTRIQRPFRVLV
jgi:TRAP-type C4-dicarboxylate transport system substrate-binding protein